MKLFDCQVCGQTLSFENIRCEGCGHRVGFVPHDLDLHAVVPVDGGAVRAWQVAGNAGRAFPFCLNAQHDACNWLVTDGAGDGFCLACRHNNTIPNLSRPDNLDLWRLMEVAKHRLFYTLIELRLPIVSRDDDPAWGLVFEFNQDPTTGPKVMTGHSKGRITIAIAEADDAERERRRKALREPYRTLLGHFRHEIAHYYWDRLVRDTPALGPCRATFGDERTNYKEALKRHYREGPPPDWKQRFVSSYATAHPWEDFAETFAHYLHIVDTLDTAGSFGVTIHPRGVAQGDALAATVDFHPEEAESIAPLVKAWLPLTFAFNSLNRSMGLGDLYPFVLNPAIIEKLGFVHDLVRGRIGEAKPEQPSLRPYAPVPEDVLPSPGVDLPSGA
ncbi:MAG: zinc-binding metallopeptidase family protein [Janthinobacterium lividum]